MIQRIQSLYILIYLFSKSFLLYTSLLYTNPFNIFVYKFDLFPAILIFLIAASAIALFNFKNRKVQIKILYFQIIIQLIILISILILACSVTNPIKFLQNYQILIYLIGFLLLILALIGIKKDQKLIDSIDRIR